MGYSSNVTLLRGDMMRDVRKAMRYEDHAKFSFYHLFGRGGFSGQLLQYTMRLKEWNSCRELSPVKSLFG